ncbi:MAG: hypothetical protein PHX83_11795 [Acidobacteriia bacterium]|nr:hypothetical protein [Terriglobia bacterium]
MKLVLVGGHSRNIGKTSVAAGLIRALPEYQWVAVKITQYGHGICSMNGEHCGCSPGEHSFVITEEQERGTGTDTSRFLDAGARRSLWVRTKQGELFTALPAVQKEIEGAESVIVESNSLRRFLKPTVYLQVLDPRQEDFKISAQQFFDLADAYLFVVPDRSTAGVPQQGPWINVSLSRELARGKLCFTVHPQEGFLSGEVTAFVRGKLGAAGSSHSFEGIS